jgi:type II secretory pathway pseudopilin PulG
MSARNDRLDSRAARGFTLAELAIVTLILGLMLGGLLMTLSSQIETRNYSDSQKRLEIAHDALLGFAIANGRLPCPATSAVTLVEAPGGGGACTVRDGFLPAVTIGLAGIAGRDAWDMPLRYAVTGANTNAFTTANQVKTLGFTGLAVGTGPGWDLVVCPFMNAATAGATPPCGNDGVNPFPAFPAAAVVYSLGKNGAAGTAADELENLDGDTIFITRPPSRTLTADGFDDIVVPVSPNVLYHRLISAGAI